jgi:PAS domain S-box-containing protein
VQKQVNPQRVQLGQEGNQVLKAAAEPIDTPGHHHVELALSGVPAKRPDGSNRDRVWITYWHPLKDRAGQIIGINVAAEEITDRKRIEADLAANQEELRNINSELAERVAAQAQERDRIWKLSQDLFVVSDLSGNILNINPAWSTIFGWSTDDLVGKSAAWLLHPEDRERSFAERANLSAGRGEPHQRAGPTRDRACGNGISAEGRRYRLNCGEPAGPRQRWRDPAGELIPRRKCTIMTKVDAPSSVGEMHELRVMARALGLEVIVARNPPSRGYRACLRRARAN